MSEPVLHHYVSECHIKEFYNDVQKKIYLFDKNLRNFYDNPGTKRIFSENDLNTRLLGYILDRHSLELQLRTLFEDDFSKHLEAVKNFHNDNTLIASAYEHLNFLGLMALVGEYRNPHYKRGIDSALNAMRDHAKSAGVIVPDQPGHKNVKYQNTKGYMDVAFLLLERMDPISFALVSIESNDHFILPDTSGFLVRQQLDIGPVTQFGLPVSDKLFILGRSASMGKYPTTLVTIKEDNSDLVFRINTDLANYAYKTVACKDEDFLKNTIIKVGKVGLKGQYFHDSTIGSPMKR